MKAKTLDQKFDAGDDVSSYLYVAKARRLNPKPRRSGTGKKLRILRQKILPLAKAQGLVTDQDIFLTL